jgi:transposase
MSAKRNLRQEVVTLRQEGKSFREIQKIINCSKGTIHYHCKVQGLSDTGKKRYPIDENLKISIAEYCKDHSLVEASKQFKVSISTINNYKNYKPIE